MDEIITLDYGSGGKKTSRLIESMIVPALDNPALSELGDGAVIPGADKLVFSTDSFVVDPIFFPGGSIGKLSVCGTVNDIAMCGGEPKYLSCAFIIEDGFPAAELERVVEAIREAGEKAGVQVVTGDTKVVERGRGIGLICLFQLSCQKRILRDWLRCQLGINAGASQEQKLLYSIIMTALDYIALNLHIFIGKISRRGIVCIDAAYLCSCQHNNIRAFLFKKRSDCSLFGKI